MLNYVRALVLNDVKGEILEDWYQVSLKEFCKALQNKLLQCFIGCQFWKIYWKRFAAKISLSLLNVVPYVLFMPYVLFVLTFPSIFYRPEN